MGNPPLLSLRFAFVVSVSFAASYSTTSAVFFPKPKPKPKPHSQSTTSVPKATTKDLLTLLGPPQQALSVNQQEAKELKSCFKFLVPFCPATQTQPDITVSTPARRLLGSIKLTNKSSKEAEDDELIWWPPAPVMELARLAVDSGGDPGVIHRTLDPTVIQVPDVEGSKERKCELTRTSYGRHFINEMRSCEGGKKGYKQNVNRRLQQQDEKAKARKEKHVEFLSPMKCFFTGMSSDAL